MVSLEEVNTDPLPKDVDPKELFANGAHREAKDAWVRQLKSCQYVLSKCSSSSDESPKETLSPTKLAEFEQIRHKALLNLSLVSLKLKEWADTVKYADDILAYDPKNDKAIYRKAKALHEMGKPKEAAQVCDSYTGEKDLAVERLRGEISSTLRRRKIVERRMATGLTGAGATTGKKGSWWLGMWVLGGTLFVGGLVGLALHHRTRPRP